MKNTHDLQRCKTLNHTLTQTHTARPISLICKLQVAARSPSTACRCRVSREHYVCHSPISAAVLYGCQWWQKLHLRHEPGWASGGPTIETEEASVDWALLLSAGSHMVPLWPTPPSFPSESIRVGEGKERREVGRERGRVELEAWRQGEECETNKRV